MMCPVQAKLKKSAPKGAALKEYAGSKLFFLPRARCAYSFRHFKIKLKNLQPLILQCCDIFLLKTVSFLQGGEGD